MASSYGGWSDELLARRKVSNFFLLIDLRKEKEIVSWRGAGVGAVASRRGWGGGSWIPITRVTT